MDCIFNRRIPKSTPGLYIVRPASKTWINGIPRSYEIIYDPEILAPNLTEQQFEQIMIKINDTLYNFSSCDLCFCFGYCCCLCTLGLSFCCALPCMRDCEREVRKLIKSMNVNLTKRGVEMRLRKSCSTIEKSILKLIKTEYGLVLPRQQPGDKGRGQSQEKLNQTIMDFVHYIKKEEPKTQQVFLDKAADKGIIKKETSTLLAKKYFDKYILPNQSHRRIKSHQMQSHQNLTEQKLEQLDIVSPHMGAAAVYDSAIQSPVNSPFIRSRSRQPIQSFQASFNQKRHLSDAENVGGGRVIVKELKKNDSNSSNNVLFRFADDKIANFQMDGSSSNNESPSMLQAQSVDLRKVRNSSMDYIQGGRVSFIYKRQMNLKVQNTLKAERNRNLENKRISQINIHPHHKSAIQEAFTHNKTPQPSKLIRLGFQNLNETGQIQTNRSETELLLLNPAGEEFVIKIPKFLQIMNKQTITLAEDIEQTFRKLSQTVASNLVGGGGQAEHNQHLNVLKNLRVSKPQIRIYLSKRYKKMIADKILSIFDQGGAQNFHSTDIYHYLKMVDDLVHTPGRLMDLTFNVFDVSSTGQICEHDVFQIMSTFNQENSQNAVFMNAFSEDVCQVSRLIDQKVQRINYEKELQQQQLPLINIRASSGFNQPMLLLNSQNQKRANKIEKLNNIISQLQSQNTSPKSPNDSAFIAKQSSSSNQPQAAVGKTDSLHAQFAKTECVSISKNEFLQGVKFTYGISSIADDIVRYLTGVSLKTFIQNERQKVIPYQQTKEVAIQKLLAVSLKQLRSKFEPGLISKIEDSFYKLCGERTNQQKDSLFINEDAFVKNFSKIFILENKFLARRMFHSLTGFLPQQRIYLEQFLEKLYPLFYGGNDYKNRFIFQIYDNINKGYINSIDLEEFFTKILPCQSPTLAYHACSCPFYQEVKLLSDEYVKNNIIQWSVKSKVVINFDYFKFRVGMSCLYQEFIDRIMQKPRNESILVGYGHQIEVVNKQNGEGWEEVEIRGVQDKNKISLIKDKTPKSVINKEKL